MFIFVPQSCAQGGSQRPQRLAARVRLTARQRLRAVLLILPRSALRATNKIKEINI